MPKLNIRFIAYAIFMVTKYGTEGTELHGADALKKGGEITNCFSIDVEGFVESSLDSFHVDKEYINPREENYEIEKNIDSILEFLNEFEIKGTFFFLGRIAEDLPGVVRKVSQNKHEIACHSYKHTRIFNINKDEFREQLRAAKLNLEDVSGSKVYGFRAPDFSIIESSRWALDILKELGFEYDSSIFPVGMHDVYGIVNESRFIHRLENGLIEFPLSTVKIFNKTIPFGGGGYFRIYPVEITKLFISKINQLGYPCMFYIHPFELGPVIPKVSNISFYRKFRHYYHCKDGERRIKSIFKKFKFSAARDIINNYLLRV